MPPLTPSDFQALDTSDRSQEALAALKRETRARSSSVYTQRVQGLSPRAYGQAPSLQPVLVVDGAGSP